MRQMMTDISHRRRLTFLSLLALLASLAVPASSRAASGDNTTTTPIKHVIVIIGENRSFDHLFATYVPKPGQTVWNLLSEGIVNADGSPGRHFAKAAQNQAQVRESFTIAPAAKTAYGVLPPLMTDSAPQAPGTKAPPFTTSALAALDTGLAPADQSLLLTGATGLPRRSIDKRLPNVTLLPNGPYPLSPHVAYDAYASSPVHRFFQMWQQEDCSPSHATAENPSGCLADLFPWVEVTVGAGSNGKRQPAHFSERSTGEGSTAMGFYNVAWGDMLYFRYLADTYVLSDNYHQGVMGGTGANHIMLGSGQAMYYSDGKGNALRPPQNEIENPNPQPGTNNYYTQDGYSGGSYVDCADRTQPGVAAILDYLSALPDKPDPHCAAGHYYLVNNYNPGYFGNGTVDSVEPFTIPPSSVATIGDALNKKDVSFRYYGEGWDDYVQNPTSPRASLYCNICNFLQYTTAIMTDPAQRQEHIGDLGDFDDDVKNNTLPAVVFIKPSALNDGHPASSRFDIFEAFTRRIIEEVQAQPRLWATTALFITVDEGGGYYDSGYVQPLDFFGDGTRIPLLVVSPFATGGRVVHNYADHVSLLKFIEKNWSVPPVSRTGRDNLPNPTTAPGNPYIPTNGPAISDLTEAFHF
jgi:phospholipase C